MVSPYALFEIENKRVNYLGYKIFHQDYKTTDLCIGSNRNATCDYKIGATCYSREKVFR